MGRRKKKMQNYTVRWVGVRGTVASGVESIAAESWFDAATITVATMLRRGIPDLEVVSVANADGIIVWQDPTLIEEDGRPRA